MILLDFSGTFIGAFARSPDKENPSPMLIKNMVYTMIKSYTKRFKKEYGEVVICCDSKDNWRKDYFPYYKANRDNHKESQKQKRQFEWNFLYEVLNETVEEMNEFFPYKVLKVDKTEADDIIAVLAQNAKEKTLIISSDKDFIQLLNENVSIYQPIKNILHFVEKE